MAKKIGILIENRFIEKEIFYYQSFFETEGFEVVFLTRLWGQESLTFQGLEFQAGITVSESFEKLGDKEIKEYAAFIVPAGYVADYLLYAQQPKEISPACRFIEKVMEDKSIAKGFICHSLWIAAPVKASFRGRKATCHNNIISHVENAGIEYVDEDILVDGDLITARTGGHHGAFAKRIAEWIQKAEV